MIAAAGGFVEEAGEGHREVAFLEDGFNVLAGQGIDGVGLVDHEHAHFGHVPLRHVGGVADEITLHEHIVGRRAVDRRGGQRDHAHPAFLIHAVEEHVDRHANADRAGAAALIHVGTDDHERLLGLFEPVDDGGETFGHEARDFADFFRGPLGDQRREVIQPSGGGGHAVLDELAGDAEEQEQLRAGLDGQPEIGARGRVVLHGPGIGQTHGGFGARGTGLPPRMAVDDHRAPRFQHVRADGEHVVAVGDVEADAPTSAHELPRLRGGLCVTGHGKEAA